MTPAATSEPGFLKIMAGPTLLFGHTFPPERQFDRCESASQGIARGACGRAQFPHDALWMPGPSRCRRCEPDSNNAAHLCLSDTISDRPQTPLRGRTRSTTRPMSFAPEQGRTDNEAWLAKKRSASRLGAALLVCLNVGVFSIVIGGKPPHVCPLDEISCGACRRL